MNSRSKGGERTLANASWRYSEVVSCPYFALASDWLVARRPAEDKEVMKTRQEAAAAVDKEMVAPLMQWRLDGQPAGNGWTSPSNNGAFGTDYYHRTGAVLADPRPRSGSSRYGRPEIVLQGSGPSKK